MASTVLKITSSGLAATTAPTSRAVTRGPLADVADQFDNLVFQHQHFIADRLNQLRSPPRPAWFCHNVCVRSLTHSTSESPFNAAKVTDAPSRFLDCIVEFHGDARFALPFLFFRRRNQNQAGRFAPSRGKPFRQPFHFRTACPGHATAPCLSRRQRACSAPNGA